MVIRLRPCTKLVHPPPPFPCLPSLPIPSPAPIKFLSRYYMLFLSIKDQPPPLLTRHAISYAKLFQHDASSASHRYSRYCQHITTVSHLLIELTSGLPAESILRIRLKKNAVFENGNPYRTLPDLAPPPHPFLQPAFSGCEVLRSQPACMI